MAIAFFGLDTTPPSSTAAQLAAAEPPPPTPTAADHRRPRQLAAAGRGVPGHLHGQRLEHRPDRGDHHHQHRHTADQRLVAGVHPARADRPSPPAGTPPTRPTSGQVTARNAVLQRRDRRRAPRSGHRLPGHPHRQHRQARVVHPQRQRPAPSPDTDRSETAGRGLRPRPAVFHGPTPEARTRRAGGQPCGAGGHR